jgi:mannose-6-phosphate isomerase-like protein (cupin superfamily)
MPAWETGALPREPTYLAPSGKTEIRMLPNLPSGEVTHATLSPGEISKPAYLEGLSEFFFGLSGSGEVWRSDGSNENVVELMPKRCVSMPAGVRFQYRSGNEGLRFLVVVAPRWSEDRWHEAPTGFWDLETGAPKRTPKRVGEETNWGMRDLPAAPDYLAADGSEMRLLLDVAVGGVAHARLPEGRISRAVYHQTVDEVCYTLAGEGEVWRQSTAEEETVPVCTGTCLTIPVGTRFQFRATGSSPLELLIGAFPRSPGADEVQEAPGQWDSASESAGTVSSLYKRTS